MPTQMTPRFQVEFSPETHSYWINGSPVPSVTQVLASQGVASSGNGFWKESDRRRGTAVHQIVHLLSENRRGKTAEDIIANSRWLPEKTHPALVPFGYAAAHFLADTGFVPELVEERVGSLLLQLGGGLDAWGHLPDGTSLIVDYKTGALYESAHVQTALYAYQLEEYLGLKTDVRMAVQLKPDRSYQAFIRPPGGQDLTIGIAAVQLYHWRRKHGVM